MLLLDCKDFSQNYVLWEPWKNDYDINSLGLSLKVLLLWSNFRFSFGLLNTLTQSESTSYLLAGAHGLMMHLSQLLYRDSLFMRLGDKETTICNTTHWVSSCSSFRPFTNLQICLCIMFIRRIFHYHLAYHWGVHHIQTLPFSQKSKIRGNSE